MELNRVFMHFNIAASSKPRLSFSLSAPYVGYIGTGAMALFFGFPSIYLHHWVVNTNGYHDGGNSTLSFLFLTHIVRNTMN